MPNMRSEEFGSGDQRWLGSTHAIENARSSALTVASFTQATHYPDGYIRSGTPVNAAVESDLKPWTDAAGEVLGFVVFDRKVGADPKVNVPVLRHGIINKAHLPGEGFTHATGEVAGFVFVEGEK